VGFGRPIIGPTNALEPSWKFLAERCEAAHRVQMLSPLPFLIGTAIQPAQQGAGALVCQRKTRVQPEDVVRSMTDDLTESQSDRVTESQSRRVAELRGGMEMRLGLIVDRTVAVHQDLGPGLLPT
jgi:hypothetical protein